jgi:hypothetical protein
MGSHLGSEEPAGWDGAIARWPLGPLGQRRVHRRGAARDKPNLLQPRQADLKRGLYACHSPHRLAALSHRIGATRFPRPPFNCREDPKGCRVAFRRCRVAITGQRAPEISPAALLNRGGSERCRFGLACESAGSDRRATAVRFALPWFITVSSIASIEHPSVLRSGCIARSARPNSTTRISNRFSRRSNRLACVSNLSFASACNNWHT